MTEKRMVYRVAARRILWIGGSPCAGKSTLATSLAGKYGCALYRCDEAYDAHLGQSTPAGQPLMARLKALSWNAIWMRPVETLIREEFAFYREEFPLILDDLRALPGTAPLIVEGTALLPELVAPLLNAPMEALWLVPTPGFQRAHYARRPWVRDILKQCSDPEQAFENWMRRDIGFADEVERQAAVQHLWSLRVDGSLSTGQVVAMAERWLGLAP
jgi:hypothetical protein